MEPTLLAEIEYRTKTAEGRLRHSLFRGLREDLNGRLRFPAWAKKPMDSALIVSQAMVAVSKGTSSWTVTPFGVLDATAMRPPS